MSEECREQRPLLCEDFSEEEQFAEYPRRYRPATYRGRAKYNVKGAAAIITRWPEHWSSVLTYWWLGLTMLAMMIFVIYNTVIAFALLPSAQMKPTPRNKPCTSCSVITPSHLPEIYMHLFTKPNEEVDLNKYLPYIEIMADKHLEYTFNVIIVVNDTNKETSVMSAEENNEIALNSLWDEDRYYKRKFNGRKNIKIKQVILSHYMDESPLRKDWRRIPHHFMEFLVKAVAIWEKGGISVNPNMLTPRSPHVLYMEKLQSILQRYKAPRETKNADMKTKKHVNKHKDKSKKKVNNIRDIIDALEHGEDPINTSQDNLTEAENVNNEVVSHSGRKLLSTTLMVPKNTTKTDIPNFVYAHPKIRTYFKNNETENIDDKHKTEFKTPIAVENLEIEVEKLNDTSNTNHTKMSLIPLFLEFLFHDKSKIDESENKNKEEEMVDNLTRHRKSVINIDKQKNIKNASISLDKTDTKLNEYKPMIISAKGIIPDEFLKVNEVTDIENKHENREELTIDLRGHIIATETSCHAFLGTIFSNAVHHTPEESLQDFIIAELSFFCKGLLSSCRGIDVILL